METSYRGHFDQTLNEANIEEVAQRMRDLFEGKEFAIVKWSYVDSDGPRVEVDRTCTLNSRWTSQPINEPVRVFRESHVWIGFSAGGYYYSFSTADGDSQENDDFHKPVFEFDMNWGRMTVTSRAPAGKGYLHKYIFQT